MIFLSTQLSSWQAPGLPEQLLLTIQQELAVAEYLLVADNGVYYRDILTV